MLDVPFAEVAAKSAEELVEELVDELVVGIVGEFVVGLAAGLIAEIVLELHGVPVQTVPPSLEAFELAALVRRQTCILLAFCWR